MDKKEETRNIMLVNTGRCTLNNGKEGYGFIEVTTKSFESSQLPNDEKSRWVFGKNITRYLGRSPGMVFEIGVKDDSILLATNKYLGLWPDAGQRARWDIEHKVLGQQFKLEARKKKDERFSAFEDQLTPIRDAYRRAHGLQRSLILAHMVRFITS